MIKAENCNNCRDYNKCRRDDSVACEKHRYNIDDRPESNIAVARAKTIVRVKYLLECLEKFRYGESVYANINDYLDVIAENNIG